MTRKKKNNVGRPPIEFTEAEWKYINQLLQAQCEGTAIAGLMKVHPQTLYSAIVDKYGEEYNISNFSAYQRIKRIEGLELIRAKQFEKALANGDNGMLIWLGKQYLGQREQIEQTLKVPNINVQTLDEKAQLEVQAGIIAIEEHESNDSISEEPEGDTEE